MDILFYFIFIYSMSYASCSVVLPAQVTSLLFNGYGSIPPIKKGTDTRVGFGYAFGNHADFQVVFEFGPQSNTMRLNGKPFPSNASSNKRRAPSTSKILKRRTGETDASMYLQTWAQKLKYQSKDLANNQVPSDPVVEFIRSMHENRINRIKQINPGDGTWKEMELPESSVEEIRGDEMKIVEQQGRTKLEVEKITRDLSNVDLE